MNEIEILFLVSTILGIFTIVGIYLFFQPQLDFFALMFVSLCIVMNLIIWFGSNLSVQHALAGYALSLLG